MREIYPAFCTQSLGLGVVTLCKLHYCYFGTRTKKILLRNSNFVLIPSEFLAIHGWQWCLPKTYPTIDRTIYQLQTRNVNIVRITASEQRCVEASERTFCITLIKFYKGHLFRDICYAWEIFFGHLIKRIYATLLRQKKILRLFNKTRSGPNRPAAAIGGELSWVIPWKI